MVGLILSLLVVGLVAGALARLLLPGKQDLTIPVTVAIGLVGSFVGGFLGYVLFDRDPDAGALQPSGLVGSVTGALLVLLVWVRVGGRRTLRHH